MKKIFLLVMLSFFTLYLFAGVRFTSITGDDGKISYEDVKTKLVWTRDYVTGKTWKQALKYCEELNYGGFTNWRLPNVNELGTLIHVGKVSPASDLPNSYTDWFWSSSPNTGNTAYVWCVLFDGGRVDWIDKHGHYAVRCVRP